MPPLRLVLHATEGAFTVDDYAISDVGYLLEKNRGYEPSGPLWSAGYFRAQACTRAATSPSSPRPKPGKRSPPSIPPTPSARSTTGDHDSSPSRIRRREAGLLPNSCSQPTSFSSAHHREPTMKRALAQAAARRRTVIAGYHWFTDWGRDTMISLEGLTLLTGRHAEARDIIRTFAYHVRDGLIPNMFPEGEREGLYHTADATLWFFHAIDRYERHTGDRHLVRELLPTLVGIVDRHLQGTLFGIRVDADGLLTQGANGYQLTWMDAKVDDWVVTPRRGKAVEINALWYNALCVLGVMAPRQWQRARPRKSLATPDRAPESFNARFWNPHRGFLFDIVDGEAGDDDACRPNQVLAISLPNPVLDRARWGPCSTP